MTLYEFCKEPGGVRILDIYFASVLYTIVEYVKVYLLYNRTLGFGIKPNRYLQISVLFSGIIVNLFFQALLKEYYVLGSVLILYIVTIALFEGRVLKKVLMFFPLYSFICLIDMFLYTVLGIMLIEREAGGFIELLLEFFVSLITIVILIMIVKIKNKYFSYNNSFKINWYQIFIVSLGIISFCFDCVFRISSGEIWFIL